MFEYGGLVCVFLAYGGIYYFGWGVVLAAALYVVDHLFFALAFALKTYFQKIADPADIAPTAAVAFTINHIAAVFLPALLGYLWIVCAGRGVRAGGGHGGRFAGAGAAGAAPPGAGERDRAGGAGARAGRIAARLRPRTI